MKSEIPEIIVIDDAPNAANDFAELIEAQTGLKVKSFDSPDELLDYVTHVSVKVAVIDQVMPVMKGTELYDKIKQIDPNVLAIMLTGEASKEELAKAINIGFSSYLSKNEISKLSSYVLDLFTKYEVSISKELKNETVVKLFPTWRHPFTSCHIVSCMPYGGMVISEDGDCILDIYAGQEKEWNTISSIENKIQIEKKIEQKLETEFSISTQQIKGLSDRINSNIIAQSSKLYSISSQHTESQKLSYKLLDPQNLECVYVSRRVIEQFPIYQLYRIVLRKICRLCKQAKYISIIVSKQTSKFQTRQIDHMSDGSTREIDLGIHNVSKQINPRN